MGGIGVAIAVGTFLLAVYGAALSTINHIRSSRATKRQLKVTMTLGLAMIFNRKDEEPLFRLDEAVPGKPIKDLYLEAANPGQIPITLTECGFDIKGVRSTKYWDLVPQVVLLPGNPYSTYVPASWLAVKLTMYYGLLGVVTVRAYFQDGVGTRYYSKPMLFNIDEWLAARKESAS